MLIIYRSAAFNKLVLADPGLGAILWLEKERNTKKKPRNGETPDRELPSKTNSDGDGLDFDRILQLMKMYKQAKHEFGVGGLVPQVEAPSFINSSNICQGMLEVVDDDDFPSDDEDSSGDDDFKDCQEGNLRSMYTSKIGSSKVGVRFSSLGATNKTMSQHRTSDLMNQSLYGGESELFHSTKFGNDSRNKSGNSALGEKVGNIILVRKIRESLYLF